MMATPATASCMVIVVAIRSFVSTVVVSNATPIAAAAFSIFSMALLITGVTPL